MPATVRAGDVRRGEPRRRLQANLFREWRRRLAAIERYDRYIAEAEGDLGLQAFWRGLKRQDVDDAQRFKNRLDREGEGEGG